MLTFVVMPCLNESEFIGRAVRSLGFGDDGEARDAQLIVVDNGSTDDTLAVFDAIRRRHPERIRVTHEAERGYVPPRRRGVVAAAELADRWGEDYRDVLILQADADTVYKRGYVAAMQGAALGAKGAVLEGATRRPSEFERYHPEYVSAERMVDDATEPLDAADEDEVVVDDKVCGYWLSDYLSWGGLFEEWTDGGDPVHAETTRMFIRAKLSAGARKVRVNPAGAASSRRRVESDPRLHFATSGFPRERSWTKRWSERRRPPLAIDEFARAVLAGEETEAVFLRRAHQIALFRFLPALVSRAAGCQGELSADKDVEIALRQLPSRSREELATRPGLAITDVLGLIDTNQRLFFDLLTDD